MAGDWIGLLASGRQLALAVSLCAAGVRLPTSSARGDLNGDGRPDVLVTNGGANAVGVLLSHGSNDYLTRYWPVTEYPHANLIHDLNGDGRPDLGVITAYGGLRILPQWCW